jgi:hypothetical protein
MEDSVGAPVTESKYCFERSELRVMQNTAANNEEFLNMVADLVGSLGAKVDDLRTERNNLDFLDNNKGEFDD